MRPYLLGAAMAALLSWSCARPVLGLTLNWNTIHGTFTTASNWNDSANASHHVAPGPADTAVFKYGDFTSHNISIPGRPIATPITREISRLKIGTGVFNFIDSYDVNTQLPAVFAVDSADTLHEGAVVVGDAINDAANLNIELANFTAGSVTIGNPAQASGTMDVLGEGSLNITGTEPGYAALNVGYSGSGYLTIRNRNFTVAGDAVLGRNAFSSGRVTINGTPVSIRNLQVGLAGDGRLIVESNASVTCNELTIGGSASSAEVYGIGPAATTSLTALSIKVGATNDGLFEMGGGGKARSTIGFLGFNGKFGRAFIDGAGSKWTVDTDLAVGTQGNGLLSLFRAGEVAIGGLLTVGSAGIVEGTGTITGNVSNSGIIAPSSQISFGTGTLRTVGNLTLSPQAKLQIELGGTTPGAKYDQLLTSGSIAIDGSLDVKLIGGYLPHENDSFNILDFSGATGFFATVTLPTLSGNLVWNTSSLYSDGVLSVILPGDYDQNGTVDTPDYVLWRKQMGNASSLPNDDTPGVGGDDFARWRAHVGQTAAGGTGSSVEGSLSTVPEPASTTSIILFLMIAQFANWGRVGAKRS